MNDLAGRLDYGKLTIYRRHDLDTWHIATNINAISRGACDERQNRLLTVCLTVFRATRPSSIIAVLLPLLMSAAITSSTILATYVYTSDGRSVTSRLTCWAPTLSPPNAA